MQLRTLCALVSLVLASCSAPQFTAQAIYSPFTPDGDVSLTTGGGAVNADNSLDDLGIEDEAGTLGLRADFKWGLPHLTVMTQSSKWDGTGTLQADYGGITAGTNVDSELELGLHRALLTFDILPTDMVELGIGAGVTVIDAKAKAKVEDTGGAVSESADETLPLPVLAVRAGARLWRIDLEALVAGLSGTYEGDEATYLEIDVNGRFAIFGSPGNINGSVLLGFRSIEVALDYEDGGDDVESDLNFTGPYVGVQIGF